MERACTNAGIIAGVDTHKDTHTAAALDAAGRLLGIQTFPASPAGYAELLGWLRDFGEVDRVGIEGTSSYGSGLTRYLAQEGLVVVEVSRPNRQARRRNGKSDPADAQAAARTVLANDELGQPKSQDGPVEIVRLLRLQRRSAIQARTQAANQVHAVLSTAPEPLRSTLRQISLKRLISKASKFRQSASSDLRATTKLVLRGLAQRWLCLNEEISALDKHLDQHVRAIAPELLELKGVGTDVAGTLLVAAGDNPTRLAKEASFAALCGVSPVDASSGRQHRHRLNRGGNRDANRALWVVALVRLRCDPETRKYAARRTAEGMSKPEILRCLKRYIARQLFRVITPRTAHLSPSFGP